MIFVPEKIEKAIGVLIERHAESWVSEGDKRDTLTRADNAANELSNWLDSFRSGRVKDNDQITVDLTFKIPSGDYPDKYYPDEIYIECWRLGIMVARFRLGQKGEATKDDDTKMSPDAERDLALRLKKLIQDIRRAKPHTRSQADRYYAVSLTDLEHVYAYWITYLCHLCDSDYDPEESGR